MHQNFQEANVLSIGTEALGTGTLRGLKLIGASLNINGAYSIPVADGSANQVLKTDGIGGVTWQDASLLVDGITIEEITGTADVDIANTGSGGALITGGTVTNPSLAFDETGSSIGRAGVGGWIGWAFGQTREIERVEFVWDVPAGFSDNVVEYSNDGGSTWTDSGLGTIASGPDESRTYHTFPTPVICDRVRIRNTDSTDVTNLRFFDIFETGNTFIQLADDSVTLPKLNQAVIDDYKANAIKYAIVLG